MLRRSRIGLGAYFSLVITLFYISSIAVEAMLPDVAKLASGSSSVSLNPGSVAAIAQVERSSLTMAINKYKASKDLHRCTSDSPSAAPCYKYDRNLNFQGIYYPPSHEMLQAGEDTALSQEGSLDEWCSSLDGGQLCRTAGTFVPRQAEPSTPSSKPNAEVAKSDTTMHTGKITIEAVNEAHKSVLGSTRRISNDYMMIGVSFDQVVDLHKPIMTCFVHPSAEYTSRSLSLQYSSEDEVLLDNHGSLLKASPHNNNDHEPFFHFPNPTLVDEDKLYIGHMDPYGANLKKHELKKEKLPVRKVQAFTRVIDDCDTINEEYVIMSSVKINPGGLKKEVTRKAAVGMIMPPTDRDDDELTSVEPTYAFFNKFNPHEKASYDADCTTLTSVKAMKRPHHYTAHTAILWSSLDLDHHGHTPYHHSTKNTNKKKKKKKDTHSNNTLSFSPEINAHTAHHMNVTIKLSASPNEVVEAIRELKSVVQEKFTAEMEHFFYGNAVASAA